MSTPPSSRPRILVFTDLDGTLLDHACYDHAPAAPALAALRAAAIPVVLASSKTAAEIAPLHARLGLGATPAIVENGAGLYRPGAAAGDGRDYRRLVAVLAALPAPLRAGFRGFHEMDDAEVVRRTGLAPREAARARARRHSEPGVWLGAPEARAAFRAALAARGVHAVEGGRFLTLSFGATKADRMAEIAREYGAPATLALGDAQNDIGMLEAADHGVIVRNDQGSGMPPLAGEAAGRIIRTALPGPRGWNRAVLDFLARDNHPRQGRRHG